MALKTSQQQPKQFNKGDSQICLGNVQEDDQFDHNRVDIVIFYKQEKMITHIKSEFGQSEESSLTKGAEVEGDT